MNITMLPDQVQTAVELLTDLRSLLAFQVGTLLWIGLLTGWIAYKVRR